MNDYIERMELELKELENKIAKAIAFADELEKKTNQLGLLRRQIYAMSEYSKILSERIKNERKGVENNGTIN